MRKTIKLLFLMFALIISIISCKKDKDDEGVFDNPYSEKTPEQSKGDVEATGVELVSEISDLENSNAFLVVKQLSELIDDSEFEIEGSIAGTPLNVISSLKNTESTVKTIFKSLKSTAEDPNSISEVWEKISAKYSWNDTEGKFDSTGSANAFIIEFPGKESDDENTAVLTINKPQVITISNPREEWPEDIEPEVPVSITADIKYDGEKIISYSFEAEYQSDGLPTSVTSSLSIEDFVFTVTVTHEPYNKTSFTYNLKRQNTIIIEVYFDASGDWSEESIEENIDDVSDEFYVEKIVKSSNAHLILLNLKIAAKVNFEAFGAKVRELDEQYSEREEDYANAMIKAINDNAKLVLLYTDTENMIAKAEAYTYYDDYYEEYVPDIRFIFSDGSLVDGETYLNDELESFFDSLNDFITELNEDYDLDIEPVNP